MKRNVFQDSLGSSVKGGYEVDLLFVVEGDSYKYPAKAFVVCVDGNWYVFDFEFDVDDRSDVFFDNYLY